MKGHIAVNTRLLLPGRVEGISRFAVEVLSRMVRRNPDIQFSFLFDRANDPAFVFGENVTPYVIPPQARHPLLWYAWFHGLARFKLGQLKPNLLFSPEFYLTTHPDIPQVPVFHDLAYEHYPKDIAPFASWYCRRHSPRFAHLASHILTVSSFSKQDLVQQYDLPEDKISVVYNGASDQFSPLPAEEQEKVRRKYSSGKPYVHFVGALHPRKNIDNLLKAFDQYKTETESPLQLLLVGRKGWQYQSALETYENMQHRDAVLFTGFVSDEELVRIYAASFALCYVPYLEGFGIPLLEAMHAETAIITGDRTSMPEVAGDAALFADPYEPASIAHCLRQLYETPKRRTELIEAGKIQRDRFSWDQTYEKVWTVLSRWL
ncbi:MAG: glycosyltransferase family 1 protein [Bacteroidota bacterium]